MSEVSEVSESDVCTTSTSTAAPKCTPVMTWVPHASKKFLKLVHTLESVATCTLLNPDVYNVRVVGRVRNAVRKSEEYSDVLV